MVLSTLYPPNLLGGAEKSVALIAGGLAERGHEVSVLTLHDDPHSTDTVQDDVTVLRRPLHNLYWPFNAEQRHGVLARVTFHVVDSLNVMMTQTIAQALEQYKPEVVLTNQLACFSTLSWKTIHDAGAAILHTFRDFYLLCPKSKMFRNDKPCLTQCLDCRILAYPRKRMSRYVDGITGVSQYMINRHAEHGLFQNALFLPSILSAVRTLPAPSARLASPPGPVRHFGYIGRLEREKGIDLLLDGLLTVAPDQWKLSIAGTGSISYMKHLRERCAWLPVEFLGFVPDTDFYNSVDVVVVPSIWAEPLPRTVLEAFGYGLTVIASDRGGIPEVLHHEETGYLIDLNDPKQMASAIARVIANPLEGRTYGERGRRMVVSRTASTVAKDYETAAEQTIEHTRRRVAVI